MTAAPMTEEQRRRFGLPSLGLPAPPPGFGMGAVFDGAFDNAPSSLPPAPPRAARSADPFSKENRRATLLDIGSAFLSNPDFFQGLGAAGQAIRGRQEELKPGVPQTVYGGPDDQFEITTDPKTGERTIREVPEFARAVQQGRDADRAKRNHLDPKELADIRGRAVYAIMQLPEDERAGAYADLMRNPGAYGNFPTEGMPPEWSNDYGRIMGNMGATVNQNRSAQRQDERQEYRERRDGINDGYTERRLRVSESRGPRSGSSNLPTGFILD